MNRSHRVERPSLRAAMAVVIAAHVLSAAAGLGAAETEREKRVLDQFQRALKQSDQFDAARREQLLSAFTELRNNDETRRLAITETLRAMYPRYAEALALLGQERIEQAAARLEELSAAENRILAAESRFFLARAHVIEEHFERALPHLEKFLEEHAEQSLYTGQAQFLLGISQMHLLKRQPAIESLEKFLQHYPGAPERMRVGAWRLAETLKRLKDDSLEEVEQLLRYSRRRLQLEYSGDQTRQAQQRAVALLDKLIEEAEQREAQGQGQGQGQGQQQAQGPGQGPGRSGQGGSHANDQSPSRVVRQLRGGPRTPWDHLRDKKRESKAFAALKARFPARYQELVEQYYRNLQEGDEEQP